MLKIPEFACNLYRYVFTLALQIAGLTKPIYSLYSMILKDSILMRMNISYFNGRVCWGLRLAVIRVIWWLTTTLDSELETCQQGAEDGLHVASDSGLNSNYQLCVRLAS